MCYILVSHNSQTVHICGTTIKIEGGHRKWILLQIRKYNSSIILCNSSIPQTAALKKTEVSIKENAAPDEMIMTQAEVYGQRG